MSNKSYRKTPKINYREEIVKMKKEMEDIKKREEQRLQFDEFL